MPAVPSGTASALFGGSRLAIPAYPGADANTKILRLKADRTAFEWVDTPSSGGVSEGDAYTGGTNNGVVFIDGSGNFKSDGPTWDGSTLAASGALTATTATFSDTLSQASGGKTYLNCTMDSGADVAYIQSLSTANSRVIVRGSLSASAGQILLHAHGHSSRPGAIRLNTGGSEAINIDNSQTVTLSGDFEHEGTNFGVFSATAVAQQTAGGITTGFTAGSGTGVNDDSTFTGNTGSAAYTIGDLVNALKLLGFLASS